MVQKLIVFKNFVRNFGKQYSAQVFFGSVAFFTVHVKFVKFSDSKFFENPFFAWIIKVFNFIRKSKSHYNM